MSIREAALLLCLYCISDCLGAVFEIRPAVAQEDEEFERLANALKPGDELVLGGGIYSQTGRRSLTVQGTAAQPITIRAAAGQEPVLTRPAAGRRYNNIEFVDCCYMVVRGLHFQGGNPAEVFIAPAEHNYLPKPGSVLVSHADPDLAPPQDFSGTARQPPFDVGAYDVPGKTPAKSPR